MSPKGFVLMAEMLANHEIDLDAIIAHGAGPQDDTRTLAEIDAWLEALPAENLPETQIDAIMTMIREALEKE